MLLTLWRCALLAHFVHTVRSQDLKLTFSSNPVYSGEPVTLTFSYGSGLQLSQLTVDAFSGTLMKGYLFCKVTPVSTTGTGVFDGKSLNGWPSIPAGATNVSVTLTATPSLELDFNCTAVVVDGNVPPVGSVLTSAPSSLQVRDMPLPPMFAGSPFIFNENENATIACESRFGRPAAAITIFVTSLVGKRATVTGIESALLILPIPVTDWHRATATCTVTNHNVSNLNVSSSITINHITSISIPAVVYTTSNNITVDCASYISSYPEVYYSWAVQLNSSVPGYFLANTSSLFVLMQGESGMLVCIASNKKTMKTVIVSFTAVNKMSFTTPEILNGCSGYEQCWFIGPAVGAIVVINAAVLCVLYGRRRCLKRTSSGKAGQRDKSEIFGTNQSDNVNLALQSADQEYEPLNSHMSNEHPYAQLTEKKNERSSLDM